MTRELHVGEFQFDFGGAMRYVLFLLIFLAMTQACYSQVPEKPSRRYGMAGGFNYFPALYFPTPSRNFNSVLYGYHLGVFFQREKLNYRTGINVNHFIRKSSIKINEYSIGYELGVEKPLLAQRRRWIFNVGLSLYGGLWITTSVLQLGTVKNLCREWGVGPVVMVGWKVDPRLTVLTEFSGSIGNYYKSGFGGPVYERGDPGYMIWKFLGIGIRYYIN